MELRHLRCFVVLAEELHFTRAAERLHIEQSPLSRTIKELEDDLGALLFNRDRRGTRLTDAGKAFLLDVRRLFTTLDQARENVKAVSAGFRVSMRIAVSDGAIDSRLSDLLARCREEEPDVEIRLTEVTLSELLNGLRSGDFTIGFTHTEEVGDGIVAEPIWHARMVAVIPARHPLLAFKEVPIEELLRAPLIMWNHQAYEGYDKAFTKLLRGLDEKPNVIERAASLDVMLALVAAGYGIGLASGAKLEPCKHSDIVIRPLANQSAVITTYMLKAASAAPSISVDRFTTRLKDRN
ncbi:LysR family transcriptional regulator [Xanthomonas phaseoli pv. phaseoli]|uniref:LysR family transcriptional regulator n=1 Tax=Xanthomonas TaxID=338 RepID=UPI00057D4C54|nr:MULTISPECIES: LysR family transcriptional regulator [Xanthomonas]MBO9749668.1 LysR family transcriptional regulator [Xanthomonas phaseoli pv. dieffenbachiae]ATS25163.1 LysR family transcriptional regulator [Xanthomonas phaseoli pv. phaseoli]KHS21083.1 D-alanyl-D-alanine endopeptidase [Xanthomonas phaseoli pv. phaseoli]KKY06329.1 D-alanyl-D-alanine endopeptidase [Xanthomonas phaseoli pv. phaseoli]KKY06970.1 D-alanyl-D-alanine endopeptidase [Xanthomonas phaseoli pv. phaseoli]